MDSSSNSATDGQIPLGIALIAIGLLILGMVALAWFMLPSTQQTTISQLFSPGEQENSNSVGYASQPRVIPTLYPDSYFNPDQPLLPNNVVNDDGVVIANGQDFIGSATAGIPTRLIIPAIDLDASVDPVGLQSVIVNGQSFQQWQAPPAPTAGWHNLSATLGKPGNTVLNGHNNIHGEIFRNLSSLEVGDELQLYDNAGNQFTYQIERSEILPEQYQPIDVRLQNARWIEETEDERITLVSCWPHNSNTHRVIVVAKPTY